MNDQLAAVQGVVKYRLEPYFKYFMTHNSGLNNPYHNLNHTLRIMRYISEACVGGGFDEEGLLLAGLFHDFNHSGGKLSDAENVSIAINGLEDADNWVGENYPCRVPSALKVKATNYIRATQYPYVIPDKDLDPNQALIRDCDVLCYFADDWFTQVLSGLVKEMGFNDFVAALGKMESFLLQSRQTFRTEYAKEVFDTEFPKWRQGKDILVTVL